MLVPVLVLDPVVVVVVPVLVFVELSVAVDEGVCTVVVADVPVVPLPAAADVESVDCDCACEAVVAVGVGEATVSVWTDDPLVVDPESAVRRCLAIVVAGVPARCASPAVAAGRASSEVGSSATPMDRLSGEVAAWVRVVEPWCIAETVRPPPTRATAVATTALRWFFFQRARWRRRAARPSVTVGASATSSDGRPVPAAGSSWRPASCQAGASSQAVAAVPVVA